MKLLIFTLGLIFTLCFVSFTDDNINGYDVDDDIPTDSIN